MNCGEKSAEKTFFIEKLCDGRQKQLIRVKCRSNATFGKQDISYQRPKVEMLQGTCTCNISSRAWYPTALPLQNCRDYA